MNGKDARAAGLTTLSELWDEAQEEAGELRVELQNAVRIIASPDVQVAQRYALVTQLLLKVLMDPPDSRVLVGFGDDDFSARSFARYTTASFAPLSSRLGNSEDPYVSNPLRQERLADYLLSGRGKREWEQLFLVLAAVDAEPGLARDVLRYTLHVIKDWQELAVANKVHASPPHVEANLTSLQRHTGLDESELLDMLGVLESDQPQIILAGPPGTSKTHTAQALASFLTDDNSAQVTVTQLHATYGYEDFVEGLRPEVDANGMLRFEVVPGALLRVAKDCTDDDPRILILDEMNRANLPRVFGELLFAIERRGEPIDLLHTQAFSLPAQVVFIGTMNTADRSIRSLDTAVRRRFQIFELPPSHDVLAKFYESRPNEIQDLPDGLKKLNTQLKELLDRHHTIGHAFLMDERGMTAGRLNQVWRRQIEPLLEEYLFDMPDELAQFSVNAFWPTASS